MPRIRQYAEQYARKDFQQAVDIARIRAEIRNTKVLAESVGIPYTSFWRLLQEPDKITLGQLRKMLGVLPLPAAAVLSFIGYDGKTARSYERGDVQ